ncbi:MAG: DUF763 domain-containing protein, partial [Kiritimatiellae bacterium]|nr:DUF763 domain-containing protein [Kiritimatiellia bacterium]
LADPFWFQCLGCVLGFDWHSSGVTTTTCGALKEGIRGREKALGIFIAGGKGMASRKTPDQIRQFASETGVDGEQLVYASRMAAKVDSAAVQDGFDIYHHCFFFDLQGKWVVIQQGMNGETGWARRYHWLGDDRKNFVCEPHSAVCSEGKTTALNMVALEAEDCRKASTELSRLPPAKVLQELLAAASGEPTLRLPERHPVLLTDVSRERLARVLLKTYEQQPENFEKLLGIQGVGAKTVRALSLLAELIHGAKPSFRDPARFSFAHGGKDGTPYPVDRNTYDHTVQILETAVAEAKIGRTDKIRALRRLASYVGQPMVAIPRSSEEASAHQIVTTGPRIPVRT